MDYNIGYNARLPSKDFLANFILLGLDIYNKEYLGRCGVNEL